MAFKILTKPKLGNTAVNTQKLAVASKQDTVPTSSSNAAFGINDVPDSAKQPQFKTQEQVKEALKRGELMYGPVPTEPTVRAIDNVRFDYCDGLRIVVPAVKDGEQKKKYFIRIIEGKMGVVLHSGMLESGSSIATVQKFYTELNLDIISQEDIPEDIIKRAKDKALSKTMKVFTDDDYAFVKNYLFFPDMTADAISEEYKNKHMTDDVDYIKVAAEELLTYIEDNRTYTHVFNPKDQVVMVQLPVGTIGDSVGWFAYMERFQKKLDCKLVCVMNPAISKLFKDQYPDIDFIGPADTLNYQPYACYRMGLFFKGDTHNQPYDFRYIGNHRTVSKILDVNDDDIAPRVNLTAPRQIKEPYVCIAVQASAYCKLWNNPNGWHDVIKHLKEIGYRVLCIDKEPVTGQGIATNHIPWGAEDWTGNRPLQERIDILKDCDFFIGLSSGVSWLAWCAKCPVVMISGFTNPFNEFYTPYRVINTLFCHGCWNDERCEFDHYDYMWCPRHKGTPQAYECSRNISSKHVLNTIKTIPSYQAQLENHIRNLTVRDVNKYIVDYHQNDSECIDRINYCDMAKILTLKDKNVATSDIASTICITEDTVGYAMSAYYLNKKKFDN